jgi:tetratricopeptide (TPR) repeat protein
MKAVSSILYLSVLLILESGCRSTAGISKADDCGNRKFRDSLIVKYVDKGAERLPYMYNNPLWESYLDSILLICPNIATAYQLKAVPAIKNGEYIKAYRLDEKAAELDSQQFVSYLGFLKCIFTKDYAGAIIDFNRAIRIIPGGGEMDHGFYFYLGICYLELGNYPESEMNFNKDIFSQNQGDSTREVHFNSLLYMGIVKSANNEIDSAEIYLKRSLQIYGELPEANYYLALIYKKRHDTDLERRYLGAAKKSILAGYSMNEDNLYYVNYPRQITLYEINRELSMISNH